MKPGLNSNPLASFWTLVEFVALICSDSSTNLVDDDQMVTKVNEIMFMMKYIFSRSCLRENINTNKINQLFGLL